MRNFLYNSAKFLLYKWRSFSSSICGHRFFYGVEFINADFISIGSSTNIERYSSLQVINPMILPNPTIILKDFCWIGKNVEIQSVFDSRILVNDYVSIQDRCKILGSVTIGKYCILAPDIFISSGDHFYKDKPHFTIRQQDNENLSSKELFRIHDKHIFIEEDCWIGKNVFIASGVYIGRGAVIGTNSIVKRDVEPYTVNVGTPLTKVKDRLSFEPMSEISAFIPDNLPYFYRGFEHYQPNVNISDVIIHNFGIRSENTSIALLKKTSWTSLLVKGSTINRGDFKIYIDGSLYVNQVLEARDQFELKIHENLVLKSTHADSNSFIPALIKNYLVVQFEFKSSDSNKYNFLVSKISSI